MLRLTFSSKIWLRIARHAAPVPTTRNMATSRSPSPPSKRMKFADAAEALSPASPLMQTSQEDPSFANGDDSPAPQGMIEPEPVASTSAAVPPTNSQPTKASANGARTKQANKRKKQKKKKPVVSGGLEDTMFHEAIRLLGKETVDKSIQADTDYDDRFQHLSEVELEVVDMSSHGEGLAITEEKDWIVAVPFCVPGERVLAKIYRNDRMHSYADLVKILRVSQDTVNWRDDSRIGCKYFGTCSGCQYQMLSYEKQLDLKRNVVIKAYENFSQLSAEFVPEIGQTLPSPQQYGYRTKLTPHFDAPNAKMLKAGGEGFSIGFMQKGRRTVLDIEECPIGTPAINAQMAISREEVKKNYAKYKRGATILLRDSLPLDVPLEEQNKGLSAEKEDHICVTDHHMVVRERVADKMFTFSANSFFQNNNGILRALVESIRDIIPDSQTNGCLVDAYCGSGLFALTLAEKFKAVAGVEISAESIRYAKLNAEINKINNVTFLAGSAEAIFKDLPFTPSETTILIDPPRKGCDDLFIDQLLAFSPARIVYVSCNVHTQARDVGQIVARSQHGYRIDSIRGCDLFPQTYHVEGLAVLSKV